MEASQEASRQETRHEISGHQRNDRELSEASIERCSHSIDALRDMDNTEVNEKFEELIENIRQTLNMDWDKMKKECLGISACLT